MSDETFRLRVESDIRALSADTWDACAPVLTSYAESNPSLNPFINHAFLSALEESGSVAASTGWLPQHLVLEGDDGEVLGVCPAYLKSHSQGEYVFDHGWAEAYERAGGRYYPKLQVSVPFTPATGPRLLAGTGPQAESVRQALAAGLVALAKLRKVSSVHATFLTEADAAALEGEGFLPRADQQFHWRNEGYGDFEAFLDALASRKRKQIRRERREALENGITVHWLTGSDLTEDVWDAFFGFYMETGARKWGRPYLNRAFYSMIGERMPDRILLVMAKRAGRWIAGAINFIGADTLYGRHWGAIEHHPFLHFEICYHQAIDYAIAHGLRTVEAGAQGEHKLARGYMPVITRSAHYIADAQFRAAVAHYLDRERRYVAEAGAELSELGPFRQQVVADTNGEP
ncbi:GNAT family N-acetyltransferase [Ancylobacter sp.]|uniref:GNAT family N-acetyltransferase n=1 Tax=Ancylobacter sp. TaxID=1872567 RepID=UPI003C7B32AC